MKANILIIEDNEQNLYLITFILESRGHTIIPAMDGESGIRIAGEIKPDIILLDIQLPGLDGYEVAKRLRNNPDLKNIPIVAVTSYAMVGDKEKALESGCTGYIEKPINPDTFPVEVEKFLKNSEE
ncbi:MAG: response regulator [Candidatus Aminicenantes bacterium]|nr:response regulator [Candidatus Aminicenantes bacterium]